MSIRQVFGLHKIRLQNLKAHIHLCQQHHQIDLQARKNQLIDRTAPDMDLRSQVSPPLHQDSFTLSGGGTYSRSSRDRGQPRGRWEAQKSCTSWRLYRLSATDMGSLRHTSVGTGYMGLQLNGKEDGSSREAPPFEPSLVPFVGTYYNMLNL